MQHPSELSARLLNITAAAVVSSAEELGAAPTCTIATHSGSFHCDEALATAMLRLLPQFAAAPIIRTRDADAIAACTIAVDVGGVYDAATLRFDHHQRTFETLFDGRDVTKLSSAGLVYVHYGREVVAAIAAAAPGSALPAATLEMVYQKVYVDFVEGVDAIDNGVSRAEGPDAYKVRTDLGARVGCVVASLSARIRRRIERRLRCGTGAHSAPPPPRLSPSIPRPCSVSPCAAAAAA